MGEKGTAAWRSLKYAGLIHILNPFEHPENVGKIGTGMDSGEITLDNGQAAAWDDEKGQWINVLNGEALSASPNSPR